MDAPASPQAPAPLAGIVIVLWESQNLVNIAATIRAMKNFGLRRLRLVSPAEWDPHRVEGIAHDTGDLIAATEIVDTLDEALADCAWIVALTARERRAKRTFARPREIVPEILARGTEAVEGTAGPVALLFGREDRGLPNEALDRANRTVVIPTSLEHRSLNLAQAALLICYELWMAASTAPAFRPPKRKAAPATGAQIEQMFVDIERSLWSIEFFKTRQTEAVMRTLREIANRAGLDSREAGFLRAIAIEVTKFIERTRPTTSIKEGE